MNRNCPCCSHPYKTPFYTTQTGQNIVSCDRCRMVYAVNTPQVDYANASIYAAPTYDAQVDHYKTIVNNVKKHISTRIDSVLDIGCATGELMQEFTNIGVPQVTGVSISPAEVQYCIERGLNAKVKDICSIPAEDSFDLVTVSHVLEHVPDVQEFLSGVARWTTEHGSVYIEVPNALKYTSYFAAIGQGFNAEHINHFDLAHLVRACIGWEVSASGSYEVELTEHTSYPVIWLLAHPHTSSLVHEINIYAQNLSSDVARMRDHLHKELEGVTELAVWGTGQTTQTLLAKDMLPKGVKICYATDSNPIYHDRVLQLCRVNSPENFHPPVDVPILVGTQLNAASVLAQIKSLNLDNRIVTLDSIS